MRVLIAEDDLTSRRILQAILKKWGYDVTATADGAEALAALTAEDPPRLAVLDWMMPELDGVEVCSRIRELQAKDEQYTYCILLTAKGAREHVVAGMEAGADDYIVKPYDQHELRVRIRAGQRIVELQRELLAAKEHLHIQSRTDALTGVLNRRAILDLIEAEMSRCGREGKPLSLSILDIDHFKRINDTYGHISGDVVLKEFARRVAGVVRVYDSLGRFGGEEFLVVLPGAQVTDAANVGERIRASVAGTPMVADNQDISVTVSQGVACWDGAANVEGLIAAADHALYRAKETGRNRVEISASNADSSRAEYPRDGAAEGDASSYSRP